MKKLLELIEGLNKTITSQGEEIKKIAAQPAAPKGALPVAVAEKTGEIVPLAKLMGGMPQAGEAADDIHKAFKDALKPENARAAGPEDMAKLAKV